MKMKPVDPKQEQIFKSIIKTDLERLPKELWIEHLTFMENVLLSISNNHVLNVLKLEEASIKGFISEIKKEMKIWL